MCTRGKELNKNRHSSYGAPRIVGGYRHIKTIMNECFKFRLDYDEITLHCERQRNICIVGGTEAFEKRWYMGL